MKLVVFDRPNDFNDRTDQSVKRTFAATRIYCSTTKKSFTGYQWRLFKGLAGWSDERIFLYRVSGA